MKNSVQCQKKLPLSSLKNSGGMFPDIIADWFSNRGWRPHDHQFAIVNAARRRQSTLLIAPTGGGKTLAGFLPSLIELFNSENLTREREPSHLHTLYVSPLKALAVDVSRNLLKPIGEMNLDIKVETRTGDTPPSKRERQRRLPPDFLLTTPEQVSLMLSHPDSKRYFSGLRYIILDELHSLVSQKRGDLLALAIARLRTYARDAVIFGLSATVAWPSELRAFLVAQDSRKKVTLLSQLIIAESGRPPHIRMLGAMENMPWSGHTGRYAVSEIYNLLNNYRLVLIFVNTRSQAEMLFQELWHLNSNDLPIALHHGSLDVQRRRKIENAMAEGRLRAIVCTSTLDLGIDWGDVDLVINVGAPKGASRLAQRIGRSNHRLDETSEAILVPANRFEVLECQAAMEAAEIGDQDTPRARAGALDVLAQHVLGMACAEPFHRNNLYEEIITSSPYSSLTKEIFEDVVEFVATGGYALEGYDKFSKLRRNKDGAYRISNTRMIRQYRLNVGTIVESPMLKVRLIKKRRAANKQTHTMSNRGGVLLGEVEEWFLEQLVAGDTFLFAGEILCFETIHDDVALVSRANGTDAKVPSYQGGKFPLSTYLADRVRSIIASPDRWKNLPEQVAEWLTLQKSSSTIPNPDGLLVETFPRRDRHYLVCYPFEGRLAHQSLGMLLTRRLDRIGAAPLGFVASEYALAVWGIENMSELICQQRLDLGQLFEEDMLGDDLDAWLAESNLMKRTFRICSIISGLVERRFPGQEKNARQVNFSSDLIYDVLRSHQPDHILLRAAWADAAHGLLDIGRISNFLKRIKGRIRHISLDRVSPLAVPIMTEIGREPVFGAANDRLLRELANEIMSEATKRI